jgi:threonyl-tRNA synthetase
MAEFGKVHRYEPSGALHGLLRVRHFTQDDAHIFCTPAQMQDECARTIALVFAIYRDFGFDDVAVKLSTRPANRIGTTKPGISSKAPCPARSTGWVSPTGSIPAKAPSTAQAGIRAA